MSALFPTWSNRVFRSLLFAALTLVPGSLIALMVYVRTPWNTGQLHALDQPVQFDHRHHVLDDQIPCIYCHRGAESSAYAGVPATSVCMGCHAQIWNDSPLLEPVRDSYFSGLPLTWNRVHSLPDFVYFDHSVHVQRGLGCATCHGQVERMARVFQVAPLTMEWCLDCHRAAGAIPSRANRAISPWGEPSFDLAGFQEQKSRAITALTTCSACHR
jgi:hypothetical protein